jgi:predicted XRE-type DNA-binding protein
LFSKEIKNGKYNPEANHGPDQAAPEMGGRRSSGKEALTMAAAPSRANENPFTESSGNVFSDLGFKDADTLQAKALLAIHIKQAIKARRLTQARAAEILGIDQPKVSAIMAGRVSGFSTDRLLRLLTALGCDVRISISRPHPRSPGHVTFT